MKNWYRSLQMPQDNRPLIIGITGNIGSGKSSVSALIREKGYRVISADEIAKNKLESPEAMLSLMARWGADVVIDGKPDRARIASIVFNNPDELSFLNALIHPLVLRDFAIEVDSSTDDIIFFEVPLLFEAKLNACFDYIILVTASPQLRFKRLMQRDSLDREDIQKRIDSQIDDSQKLKQVDIIIDNNSTLEQLRLCTERSITQLQSLPHKKTIPFDQIG